MSPPVETALYASSRQVESQRSIRLDAMAECLSATYFWRRGSARKEISCPGGSILSNFSMKSSAVSMPSRVTDVYFHMSRVQGDKAATEGLTSFA